MASEPLPHRPGVTTGVKLVLADFTFSLVGSRKPLLETALVDKAKCSRTITRRYKIFTAVICGQKCKIFSVNPFSVRQCKPNSNVFTAVENLFSASFLP